MGVVIISVSALALIFIGLVLLFYKRKTTGEFQLPAWLDKLPESAKQAHLRELYHQTPPKFTKLWFTQYWQGERTAFYAWFTGLIGSLFISIIIASIYLVLPYVTQQFVLSTLLFAIILVLWIFNIFYETVAAIVLWKCAKNSTFGFKCLARIWAIFLLLRTVSILVRFII